jgi:putative ABC transport system substrate-binding protein
MAIKIARRKFIAAFGGTAVTWPLALRAQQPAMPVIGFLNGASPDSYAPMVTAFRQGLKETGYVEGENVAIEYRWADGHYDRLAALAGDLVHRGVSVIAATSTPADLVAKAATSTIPIVFTTGSDPVQLGLVESLNRPGGNVTGVTQMSLEVEPKQLELAHALVPKATIVAVLVNPNDPRTETMTRDLQAAAITFGLQLNVLGASTEAEIDDVFTTLVQQRAGVLVICPEVFFNSQTEQIAALTIRYSIPAIYQHGEFAAAGGLASYGGSLTDSYRLAGEYTGRILKGEKPADLPVQESTKLELIVNLKTAKALGLEVPLSILGRADQVIE